jgi:aspartyl/asparaginyl beta-hydroxylase (cupin superfamily)
MIQYFSEPPFWDTYLNDVPLYSELVNNYSKIKEEILNYISQPNSLFDYPKYNVGNGPLYENYWKAVPLSNFNGEFISMYSNEQERQYINYIIERTKSSCPTANNIIQGLENDKNLANAFISRLIPGSIINPHRGWTPDYMRIHLGLVCDPECRITVGNETKTWEEGKILAFKDGGPYPHSVMHNGSTERIILSMDVNISYLKQFVPELH